MRAIDETTLTAGRPGGNPAASRFVIAGVEAIADAAGALFIPALGALVVADLHFEKGSAFAAHGQLLPPYDTAATLARLAAAIDRHAPCMVIALGDSFHDRSAGDRIAPGDRDRLEALVAGRRWVWIAGNHDPQIPEGLGEVQETLALAGLVFRHEPARGPAPGEIAGHLHPAARVVSPSGSVRRRCFVTDGQRCILPAFGAYAGGLNFRSAPFAGLFGMQTVTAHVIGAGRVYAVPEANCIAD